MRPARIILLAAFSGVYAATRPSCNVHLIVARASYESPGEGVISSLSSALKQKLLNSTSEALTYPATMPYSRSIPVGVTNLKARIADYTSQCPQGNLVILGYSQGAAVMVDTLCGGGGVYVDRDTSPVTPGLTVEQGRLIKAAVGMGDPRFVPGVSYEKGTNKDKGGVAKRDPTIAQCPTWTEKLVSYCDQNDSRCASGSSLQVHSSYTRRYNDGAMQFVLGKLQQS